MSIQSEVNRIKSAVNSAYTAVGNKGGTVPASKTVANLASAIDSISGGSTPTGEISITENGTYNVTDYASAVVSIPTYDGTVV